MSFFRYFTLAALLGAGYAPRAESSHRVGAGLVEPLNRRQAYLKSTLPPNGALPKPDLPICGDLSYFPRLNEGLCGVCGDPAEKPRPRDNELGGRYGNGTIVKTYKSGSRIHVKVYMTEGHHGYMDFSLCPINEETKTETEFCFDLISHKLKFLDGKWKLKVYSRPNQTEYEFNLRLPEGLTCEHCVLRWQYFSDNWWDCHDGTSRPDCGLQWALRSCADVKIK